MILYLKKRRTLSQEERREEGKKEKWRQRLE
jgi:hypothetical protein